MLAPLKSVLCALYLPTIYPALDPAERAAVRRRGLLRRGR